jgi:hypothetical protein
MQPPTRQAAIPSPRSATTAAPLKRSDDPSFRLTEKNNRYVGRVATSCPWLGATAAGSMGAESLNSVPTLDPSSYKLISGVLEVTLPFGGCPTWAGYTIVTSPDSPLNFYICSEGASDKCEMRGKRVWSFDIEAELRASRATTVVFSVPDGVH